MLDETLALSRVSNWKTEYVAKPRFPRVTRLLADLSR